MRWALENKISKITASQLPSPAFVLPIKAFLCGFGVFLFFLLSHKRKPIFIYVNDDIASLFFFLKKNFILIKLGIWYNEGLAIG
jgi:hypothetical protein